MSRKYKFCDKAGAYFISFATVYWIDVFTREEYFGNIVESLDYCRKNKGMEIYGYCIMPSHNFQIPRWPERPACEHKPCQHKNDEIFTGTNGDYSKGLDNRVTKCLNYEL